MHASIAALSMAFALAASTAALADDDCRAPMSEWQPRSAVEQLARDKGWTVKRIKINDGCYRLYGTDANGSEIRLTVNPVTLDIVGSRDDRHWEGRSKSGERHREGHDPD